MKKETKVEHKKERASIARKKHAVVDLGSKAKGYPTLAVITLRNLPDDLLQSSKKKLREADDTYVKVSKLTVLKRVLENAGLKAQADKILDPSALILTKHSAYALNSFFRRNRKKVAAKAGQVAPYEIMVHAGDTDLPPGPALSELKNAGVNVMIKAGKISVNKDSIVAKQGETITAQKAKALQMLGILPFEVGVEMVFAYDGKYVYGSEILAIDDEKFKTDVLQAARDAMNMSINAGIYTSGSIEQLLTSAIRQGMALSSLNKEKAPEAAAPAQ